MHPFGKGRVFGVATQGQMTQEFFLAHDDAGVFTAFANQAGEVGVV